MTGRSGYTVLIDGYNVIKQHRSWQHLPLEQARRCLIQWVEQRRWPVPISRAVVVFDGPAESPSITRASLHVRFASPSADADIQRTIRASDSPARLLIISDDREIIDTAKSHGALRYPCRWLASAPRTRRQADPPAPEKPSLPAATARQITDELATRWLRRPKA